MKCFSFLIAAFFGVFSYVALSLTVGQNGLWSEKQLNEQKRLLSLHTAGIQKINDELTLEYTALQKDPDVIAAYAKKLGYVGENEKLVKITGLHAAPVTLYNTGTVLKRQSVLYISEWVCKAFAMTVFFIALSILFLTDYSRKLGSRHGNNGKKIRGIPIYDLPQV
ncbi:septum formation initiator family protein [Treponema parvum]|uniref:Septum formation initiator family protein n=1 Tax=Treponema parvum TaxID=138851 RepID=A0A975ICH7_9SPIR|nr:septum formation initiator family protein [Treponema parvum]QTQ11728.1 septum formation initiator family protein [Treponema parvum]